MKKFNILILIFILSFLLQSCSVKKELEVDVYETSAEGNLLKKTESFSVKESSIIITLNAAQKFQTITGFGGAFTESSANLLYNLSLSNRKKILDAYFSEEGANYSLTRTHINSCDFSLKQYAYAMVDGDKNLEHFSILEDKKNNLIPMILEAKSISKDGFNIIASPWTAPPWMKDNKKWVGGKLLAEYNDTWALYFSKYIDAYKEEGIDIWGLTVENEPLGNGNNWESMLFSPKEMTSFVQNHLGPKLEADGKGDIKILGYDQNRADLKDWVDEMYKDKEASKYFSGTAVHWYESTYEIFAEELQYAHDKAPNKHLIQTEACVDSEIPHWKDDAWYWSKEATDWGWDWASEKDKYLHPKYAPVNRYASDIIGCLNNWVDGWIDWNMVLDKQGGPNWFKNWCIAPIIVDVEKDEVYFTPLYYTIAHFSKFMRPGAVKIGCEINNKDLLATAVKNPDGTIALAIFNPTEIKQAIEINNHNKIKYISINAKALQTVVIKP
ncbi:glycoside hydrolase family 30 protein [Flavobacterium sp. W22_SRS_FP1]|uniref:glycoside hydrolase family 30 protein n=1 Tax=Flavobacterium sp. W22_SRS_FP1 TaxID=3240276 RepID=UPI003F8E979A